jgi:hypothetical protein
MAQLLSQNTLSFRATNNTRFIPESMITQMTEVFGDIAMGMRRLGYLNQYLMDAYYVVSKLAGKKSLLTAGIPRSLIDSQSVNELRSNMTFMQLAIANAPHDILTAEWDLQKAVDAVVENLFLSKRLQIVDLSTSVSHYRYTCVKDGRANVVGGVLSPNLKAEFETDVAIFADVDNYTAHKTGTRLPTYTSIIGGIFEPFSGANLFNRAHLSATALMSHGSIKESDEASRSALVIVSELSPSDLEHLAAAKADNMYYHVNEDREFELIYKKNLEGLRVKTADLPFADVVYTNDAATLILACQSFDETSVYAYKKKSIDKNTWRSRFLDIDGHLKQFSTEERFVFTIDDQAIAIQTNLLSLLHLRKRSNAVLIDDSNIAKWTTDAMLAPFIALSLTNRDLLEGVGTEAISNPAFIQTAHLLVSALEPIMRTRHFKIIVRDLIRRTANKAPEDVRESSYQKLHQTHLLRQVQVEAALYIMKTVGMIDVLQSEDTDEYVGGIIGDFCSSLTGDSRTEATQCELSDIFNAVLLRSNYYQHLIGAELIDVDHAIEELE